MGKTIVSPAMPDLGDISVGLGNAGGLPPFGHHRVLVVSRVRFFGNTPIAHAISSRTSAS